MSPSTKGSAGHPGSPPGHTSLSRWATVLGKVALTLGFDPAFVGGHHVIRIIAINLVIPLWLRGSGSGHEAHR